MAITVYARIQVRFCCMPYRTMIQSGKVREVGHLREIQEVGGSSSAEVGRWRLIDSQEASWKKGLPETIFLMDFHTFTG